MTRTKLLIASLHALRPRKENRPGLIPPHGMADFLLLRRRLRFGLRDIKEQPGGIRGIHVYPEGCISVCGFIDPVSAHKAGFKPLFRRGRRTRSDWGGSKGGRRLAEVV